MVRRGRSRFVRSSSSTRTVGLCACMGCGTSWTFTGKPRKGPLRRIPGRFEMRVARPHLRFSTNFPCTCEQNIGGVHRKPIVSKLPAPSRHRSPTLSQTLRASRCSPFTVSRRSKICPIPRPHQHMRKRRCGRIPKVGKLPVPSRHRPPTLSHTVRASRHSPIIVSRRSKICPIVRPRKHGCKHRCDWIPKVGILPAPSRHRPPTLSHTGRASRHSPFTVSRRSKICPIVRPRQHVLSVGMTGYRRSANCPRRRAIALPHSRRLCAPAGTAPSPCLDG